MGGYREDIINLSPSSVEKPFSVVLAGISYCDGTYKINRPKSDIYCFEYILSGSGTVTCANKTFVATGGDVYILESGKDHFYYSSSDDPWVKMWFNISGELISNLLDSYNLSGIYHIKSAGEKTKNLFETFLRQTDENKSDETVLCEKTSIILHKIILSLYETLKFKPRLHSDAEKLKNYIDLNTFSNISVKTLAELIYHSPSQTIRIFKAAYGTTPHEYALERKINTAKHMLKNTGLSVKEIAARLGFSDEHYFSGFFKRRTNFSPKQYRNSD